MAYNKMEDEPMGAAAALSESKPSEDTFFLPPDFPGIDSLKPGQMVKLKVVGRDAEGGLEVAPCACKMGEMEDEGEEAEESDWKSDLKNTMSSEMPETSEPEY